MINAQIRRSVHKELTYFQFGIHPFSSAFQSICVLWVANQALISMRACLSLHWWIQNMKCKKIVVFGVFNCQTLEKLENNTIKNCQISVYIWFHHIEEGWLNFSLSWLVHNQNCQIFLWVKSPIQLNSITENKNTGCYGVPHIMLVIVHTPNPLMDLKFGMRTDNG
jgi:hypothetical protein